MRDTASWLPQSAGASSRNLALAIKSRGSMTQASFKQRLDFCFVVGLSLVSVLIVGLSYGAKNILSYTRGMMQNFLEFRDNPIIPLRRSPQSSSEFMYEFRSQKHNTMPSLSSLREVVQRVHQNHNITSRQKNLQKKEKKGLTATTATATKKKANDIPPVKIREREDWLAAG